MSEETAVSAHNLTKLYGRKTGVEGVSFDVAPGEIIGFLGPNGSGKTTVLRMLVGLLSITRGSARVLGQDVTRARPYVRADIGYLPGSLGLYEHMTAAEYFGFLSRMRRRDCTAEWSGLCERFALDPYLHIRSMSKGTRQKVGVIQAFMHSPRLLILDEPTSGLDPIVQHEFDDVLSLARSRGAAVLLSSHVMSEVERLASKVAILNAGRLVAFDHVEDLPGRGTRHIVLEFGSEPPEDLLAGVANFELTSRHGRRLEGVVTGSQREALQTALDAGLVAVFSPEPSLDELFRDLVAGRNSSRDHVREPA